jgi:hypothetical protein
VMESTIETQRSPCCSSCRVCGESCM